jgi:hypothetical protein
MGKSVFILILLCLTFFVPSSCVHVPRPLNAMGELMQSADPSIQNNLRRHLEVLTVDIGSRSILEPEKLAAAGGYIEDEFRAMGLKIGRQEYHANGQRTVNIIAHAGSFDPSLPAVLLGAHYDTVPGTPGADDNASAVAVLLDTARKTFSESPGGMENILFVAFSTEEPPSFGTGRMGSRVFVGALDDLGYTIKGAIILEMVGYFDQRRHTQLIPAEIDLPEAGDTGDFLAIVADGPSSELAEWTQAGYRRSESRLRTVLMKFPDPRGQVAQLIRLSDHASFWDAGIPAVMITDTSFLRNPNYHRSTDKMEVLSIPAMANLVIGLTAVLENAESR